jgi:hypothetical protein
MRDVAGLVAVGKELERRVDAAICAPADRAGESATLVSDAADFLESVEKLTRDLAEGLVDGSSTRVRLGELQVLLKQVCRIGRVFNFGRLN